MPNPAQRPHVGPCVLRWITGPKNNHLVPSIFQLSVAQNAHARASARAHPV